MAKQMVYFNAIKQIETITIHYNSKLDGTFVEDVASYIKEIAKKMTRINLKNPRDYYVINVYVYPSVKVFNQIFNGVIEKRYYNRRRSLEDFYVVQDGEGNIHIASPRGMTQEKREALKRILVMKVLGEYMDEKDKQMADKMLRASMLKKKQEEEEKNKEEQELNEDEEELEEELEDELEEELEDEELEDELEDEELEELINAENEMEDIDDKEEELEEDKEQDGEIPGNILEARNWLSLGWMGYLRGRLNDERYVKYFADHISKNGVKKLSKLTTSGVAYNYSQEFATAIVEYIIVTYGVEKFTEFYEDPTDYKYVFGTTKLRFEQEVKAYIYSKYGPDKMKEEIEQREIDDITQIRLNNAGGAEITSIKEEAKERKVETEFMSGILGLENKL